VLIVNTVASSWEIHAVLLRTLSLVMATMWVFFMPALPNLIQSNAFFYCNKQFPPHISCIIYKSTYLTNNTNKKWLYKNKVFLQNHKLVKEQPSVAFFFSVVCSLDVLLSGKLSLLMLKMKKNFFWCNDIPVQILKQHKIYKISCRHFCHSS
jgi:hypothetical protein